MKRALYISSITIFTLALFGLSAFGQNNKTIVYGKITEASSGSPIPFCAVSFKNSSVGTTSDELGNYTIETNEDYDSINVQYLGYEDHNVQIVKNTTQKINFQMITSAVDLGEIVFVAGEDPAYDIIREVISKKETNSPEKFETAQYTTYNKIQFDLNNFTDKIKNNLLIKPFPFIWEYQDSLPNGVRYLPFLFKENVRQHYFRKEPKAYKEVILADQKHQFYSGPAIEGLTEELYLNLNVYENFLPILNKNFPSPLNNRINSHYRYILADEKEIIDGQAFYKIKFIPLGKRDVAFTGHIYIDVETSAVKRVELSFSVEANVNFVRSFYLKIDYIQNTQEYWVNNETSVLADFTVAENSPQLTGFYGRRFTKFSNYVVDEKVDKEYLKGIEEIEYSDSIDIRKESFWEKHRSSILSQEEKDIAILTDTIQKTPTFKKLKKIFSVAGTGWYPNDKIDIGNVFSFYSYNRIEGSRIKFGTRSIQKINDRFSFLSYGAYGLKDKRLKYGLQADYIVSKNRAKHNLIGIDISKDIIQLGRSQNIIPLDHIFSSLIVTAAFDDRLLKKHQSIYIERQWFTGMVTRIKFFTEQVENAQIAPFTRYDFQTESFDFVDNYQSTGLSFSARLALSEPNVRPNFNDDRDRFFMLPFPVFSFEYTGSFSAFNSTGLDFHRLRLRIEHQKRLNKLGYLDYRIELGKLWGEVPFPYLNFPIGNQSILNDDVAFNLMNYAEFATDEYISIQMEHHFEGLILNRIPGINRLKWRLFLLGKTYIGRLSQNKRSLSIEQSSIYIIDKPYFEAGFGIENIIKLGRVDFTWRLSYLNHRDIYRFLPKPSFQFRF